MSELDQQKTKPRKRPEEILEAKRKKLEKVRAELLVLERAQTKKARKDRDTAIFTAGACILAALEDEDPKVVENFANTWQYLAARYPLLITDYRRECLNKTALRLDTGDDY